MRSDHRTPPWGMPPPVLRYGVMTDAQPLAAHDVVDDAAQADAPKIPLEPAAPITSRFLFVDVASMRAKQLRRGARLRYENEPGVAGPRKPERMAMEEVRRRLVQYDIPEWHGVTPPGQA